MAADIAISTRFRRDAAKDPNVAHCILNTETGIPTEGNGSIWWMNCFMTQHVQVHDGMIVIAKVHEIGEYLNSIRAKYLLSRMGDIAMWDQS